jgi:hypothetical protein
VLIANGDDSHERGESYIVPALRADGASRYPYK